MAHAGNAIYAERTALRMSQDELASLAGVAQGYLSLVEQGKANPSPRWLRDVTEALAAAVMERRSAS